MILLDTNYILRFLLRDDEEMYQIAKNVIQNSKCFINNEVIAEVVYVLLKVYKVPKDKIENSLKKFIFLPNINTNSKKYIAEALKIFSRKNLDFVDAILCAKSKDYEVKSFDKKLNRCIENF